MLANRQLIMLGQVPFKFYFYIVQQIKLCAIFGYDCAFYDTSVKFGTLLNVPKRTHFRDRDISNFHF